MRRDAIPPIPRKVATLLPLGGPKGSALSFMIECLCSLTVDNPIIAPALAAGGALDAPFLNGVAIAVDLAAFGDPEHILGRSGRIGAASVRWRPTSASNASTFRASAAIAF